jgi:serine/threonine-protein kinase HipA
MRCHSCLKRIHSGFYCTSCLKSLFDGRKIKPLDFDKTEFYDIKKQMTNRISLSGVQDKISLTYGNNNDLVPTQTDGRFILKPIPIMHGSAINLKDLAANEHLSMQISSQVFKIPTALNGLIAFKDGELAYITKRFDYSISSSHSEIIKSDQEDFASVLSYTKESAGKNYKYESSYEECANGIKKFVAAHMLAIEDFYKRVLLNYLIGNGDAHLKNFSLIREAGRVDYALSPNYDILFTKYHLPQENGITGLDLFKEYETEAFKAMGYYTLEDFEEFAKIIGIPDRRVIKIFNTILSDTDKVYQLIEHSFLSNKAKIAYKENYDIRLKNCLCYSIESYSFRGITQETIDNYR